MKTIIWSVFFVTMYLSIFVYGIIWLDNGYKVDDILREYDLTVNNRINKNYANLDNKINNLEERLMNSAFKGKR